MVSFIVTLTLLFVAGLPWSVYGWFYSNTDIDPDVLFKIDTQSFIISSDVTSALLNLPAEKLTHAHDEKLLFGTQKNINRFKTFLYRVFLV